MRQHPTTLLLKGATAMYLQNKYTSWYYDIVHNAKSRTLPNDVYFEKHHIIPVSLGGSNNKENIVKLTAKEHYVCHHLLTKMTIGLQKRSMWFAFWRFINVKNTYREPYIKVTAITYSLVKEEIAKYSSELRKGTKASPELKKKFSELRTGNKNAMWGKKHKEESIRKIKEARKKQDNSHLKNRIISQEWREKIRNTLLLGSSTKGIPKPKVMCNCCKKQFAPHIIKRWHGDNCKSKSQI